MAGKCRLTVLMPVFNGQKYLRLAIDSILQQTYQDFELLILDDGSTDATPEIIHSYLDHRIRYVKNEHNLGIVKTLNKGIDLCETELIARMDADDVSMLDRFEKQVAYLDSHPDIMLVGSAAAIIDQEGKQTGNFPVPVESERIKTGLFFSNVFIHSTILLRRSKLLEHHFSYDAAHIGIEDYGLWFRLSRFYKLANMSDQLLCYRMNPEGITSSANRDMEKRDAAFTRLYLDLFRELGIKLSESEAHAYRMFVSGRLTQGVAQQIGQVLESLLAYTSQQHIQASWRNYLSSVFRGGCIDSGIPYRESLRLYQMYFRDYFRLSTVGKVKLLLKGIVNQYGN